MPSLGSLLDLLVVLGGVFLIFVVPALAFLAFLRVGATITGVVNTVVILPVFQRLPVVEEYFTHMTASASEIVSGRQFETRRLRVVARSVLIYTSVYVLLFLPTVNTLERLGYIIFGSLPSVYSAVILFGYPVYTLLIGVPVAVGLHFVSGGWSEPPSLARTIIEWGLFLLILNLGGVAGLIGIFVAITLIVDFLFP